MDLFCRAAGLLSEPWRIQPLSLQGIVAACTRLASIAADSRTFQRWRPRDDYCCAIWRAASLFGQLSDFLENLLFALLYLCAKCLHIHLRAFRLGEDFIFFFLDMMIHVFAEDSEFGIV